MMWFHGGGGTANGALNFEADFRTLADSERFILVYPEAFPDELEGCRCWGYDFDGETNGNYQKDLEFTSAVIDDLVTAYNADRSRVYAGGYSMGASFVWDLACAKSDLVAAIAPVAANMYMWTFENCDAAAPTAVCHILGTNDFYAPYNGAFWAPSVAEQNTFWISKNGSDPVPESTQLTGGVTRFTWAPGDGCHGYQHFRRQGGGHDVPEFAEEVIWELLSQYDIDGQLSCDECDNLADVNNDGSVTPTDFTAWVNAFNNQLPECDQNSDGSCTPTDFTAWIANYKAGC
jgi:polyhydroxybutyrate depolymerase